MTTLSTTTKQKIKALGVAIGISAVHRQDNNQVVPVYFKVFQNHSNKELITIQAYTVEKDEVVGSVKIGEKEYIENGFASGPPEPLTHYAKDTTNDCSSNFLYLAHVINEQGSIASKTRTYKHVGATLFFAAMQYFAGYESCIKLEAVRNNATFWYRLGFDSSEEQNLHLQPLIKKAAQKTDYSAQWGSIWMAMSQAGREHWNNLVTTSPIRFPDNE